MILLGKLIIIRVEVGTYKVKSIISVRCALSDPALHLPVSNIYSDSPFELLSFSVVLPFTSPHRLKRPAAIVNEQYINNATARFCHCDIGILIFVGREQMAHAHI